MPFEWPFEQKLAPQSQCPNAQVRKKRISLLLLTLNVIFTSSCKLFNDTNFTQVNKKKNDTLPPTMRDRSDLLSPAWQFWTIRPFFRQR